MKKYQVIKRQLRDGCEYVELVDLRKSGMVRKLTQQEVDLMVDHANAPSLEGEEKESLRNYLQRMGYFDLAGELTDRFKKEES